jgi:hypothetical protein
MQIAAVVSLMILSLFSFLTRDMALKDGLSSPGAVVAD